VGFHDQLEELMQYSNENELLAMLEESDKIAKRQLSDRTRKDYRTAFKCLNGHTPQEYRQMAADLSRPISSRRYRVLKAAYQFHMAQRTSKAVRIALSHRNEDNYEAAVSFEKAAQKSIKALRKQEPDYGRLRYRSNLPAAHPAPPEAENKAKHSKRSVLKKLKKHPNWQADIIRKMPSQHQLATVVLAITGCRLKELMSGVFVEARNNKLEFTINGAKVTKVSGQRWRKLTFDPSEDGTVHELYEAIKTGATDQSLMIDLGVDPRTFREAHERAACKALGAKLGKGLSPNVHRHAFSADLKAEGYDRNDIALALGHTTDRTQAYYGMAQQSSGNKRGLEKVEAERKVKSIRSAADYFSSRNAPEK
tara:strand:- start:426 stop:1523 length:1098 start_codon:yes stop_codon:yes gene_type:complete